MTLDARYCPLCDLTWPAEICPEHQVPLLDPHLVPPPDDAVLPAGALVGNRYTVHECIGRGGMGYVYAARQRGLARHVALKVLRPDLARGRSNLKRFYREAQALSTLTHEHIVRVFDFGLDGLSGLPYIAMELIDGETLTANLRRNGGLPERTAARICGQIASALVEAHGKGLVHRDLKPDNIILQRRSDGRAHVKVLDFGIARLLDPSREGGRATKTGTILGTPEFMSPEQASGEEATTRSDLYALGCMFHTLLTGEPPFSGPGRVTIMVRHASEARPSLPEQLPGSGRPPSEAARALHARLLHVAPSQRPAEASEVQRVFDALAGGEVEAASLIPPAPASDGPEICLPDSADTHLTPSNLAPSTPRRRWSGAVLIGAVAGLAAIAAIVTAAGPIDSPRPEKEPATIEPQQTPARPGGYWTHYVSQLNLSLKDAYGPSLRTVLPDAYDLVMTNGEDILRQRHGEIENLTRGEIPGAVDPVIAHDREQVAFAADDGVYIMRIDGSARRRVADFGRGPAFSPDDTRLAVAELSVQDPALGLIHDGAIHVITVASGERRTLPSPPGAMHPDWSPDGRFIACAADWRVWLIAVDGSGPPWPLEHGAWAESGAWRPRFVPGGDALLAITDRKGRSLLRYELAPDSGQLAGKEWVGEGIPGIVDLTVHSAGHGAIVTMDARPRTEIVTLDSDARVIDRTALKRMGRTATPAFDHTGERLISVTMGVDERPFFTDLETGASDTPVSSDYDFAWSGRVSPDGRWFTFYGAIAGEEFGVWVGPVAGPFRLAIPDHYLPEWAPDSRHLSVMGRDTRGYLVSLDPSDPERPATIDPERIAPRGHLFTSFSADGSRLAEVDILRGGTWIRERESFEAEKLLDEGLQALWYGRRLLVATRDAVLLVDPDDGTQREVVALGERGIPRFLGLALSPDRRRLVIASEQRLFTIFGLSYWRIEE